MLGNQPSNNMHCSFDIVQTELNKASKFFGCDLNATYFLGIHELTRSDTDETVSIVTAAGAVNRFGRNDDYTGTQNQ